MRGAICCHAFSPDLVHNHRQAFSYHAVVHTLIPPPLFQPCLPPTHSHHRQRIKIRIATSEKSVRRIKDRDSTLHTSSTKATTTTSSSSSSMQRRTTSRRHLLATLLALTAMGLTQTQAFLMPPPGVAVRRAGTRMPQSTTTALQASSSFSALMEAPSASTTQSSSPARRVRRRPSSASTAAAVPPPSSSSSAITQQQQQSQRQQQKRQPQPRPTDADTLMHARVKAVQRAALAIQKQRALAKELGRAPSPSEWGEALGGITEEGLRKVLEQGTVARAALVKGWDGLVAKFVGKYAMSLSDSELQDLVVEGQLGVVEAAVRFEGGKGAGFKTYVYYWVRKRVMDAAAVYDRSTFGGVHEQRQASQIRKVVETHERESGGKVLTKEEIAKKVGLPVAKVEELSRRGQRYGLIGEGGREGGGLGVDTLQDKEGGQGGVLESMYLAEVEEAVRGALAALPREERMVLGLRLGLEDGQPKGWEEMGRAMEGCSLSYLRKVEAKAKIMLRRNVEVVRLIHRRPASFDEAFFGGEE